MTDAGRLTLIPEKEAFLQRYRHGLPQLVWAALPADLDTPVAAMLRLMEEDSPCFLLESVEKGEIRGRYSVIGLKPDYIWRCKDGKAETSADGKQWTQDSDAPLASLRKLYEASKIDIPEGLPPMAAGLVGYMGYDMVRHMEKLPDGKTDSIEIPESCFVRPTVMVIFDAVTDTMYVVTPAWVKDADGEAAYKTAKTRIEATLTKLASPLPKPSSETPAGVKAEDFISNTTPETYEKMVAAAKEHIRAGDIFQVVLSQRFSAPFALPPFSLYRALRQLNPSPFMFYLHMGGYTLVGSSPEILVRLRSGEVTIRPIAGTRKRGADRAEDELLAKELLADPKELAEHLMLLDLGRNDVGRVARVGTVRTTQQMAIENYSHVMHIVSNVVGEIDPRYDALSALCAGFPAGTVSGAPKIRAMEIIDELEQERRSFYGGCIGYFSAGGNMDTCIALRTGLIKDGKLHVQAGGGIVNDSDAQSEYEESVNKAQAVIRAAQQAARFA